MTLENQALHLENERLRAENAFLRGQLDAVRQILIDRGLDEGPHAGLLPARVERAIAGLIGERDEARAEVSGIRENCYYECVSKKHAQADINRVAKDFSDVADHWRGEAAKLRQACIDLIEHAGEVERREAALKEHFGYGDRTCFCDECTIHHNALEAVRFGREVLEIPATPGEGGES